MKGFSYILLPFFINGMVSFVGINVLVAHFEPGDYLFYSSAVSAAGVLNAIGFQWIRVYILREFPGRYSQLFPRFKDDVKRFVWLYVILTLLILVVSYFLNLEKLYWILVIIILAATQALYEITLALLRAMPNLKGFMQVNIVRAMFWLLLLVSIFLNELNHVAVLALLAASYFFASMCGRWYINEAILEDNASDGGGYSLSEYLPKGFAVSSSVVLSFVYLFLMKYGAMVENNNVFVPWFDLAFLACITPLLAANYIYQTKVVLKYDRGETFSFYIAFPVLALVVVLVGNGVFYWFVSMGYFGFPDINLANFIVIVVSMSLLAYKQNWLDHAFYLTRSYWLLTLSLLLPMVIVFMLYILYGLNLYLLALYYSGLACLMVFVSKLKIISKYMSLKYTGMVFALLLLIGGVCV